ncbi:MAG: sterol desaturase family protein [bacterium]|nr:sterol desaturase family protein [bacterium]
MPTAIILKSFATLFIAAPLMGELSGYMWHRWAAHRGVFRWLPNDFLRRRHYYHHIEQYPLKNLRTARYVQVCERAFHPLGILVIISLFALYYTSFISLLTFFLLTGGGILYAILLDYVHASYHIELEVLKKHWFFRFTVVERTYLWLRRCHDLHHLVQANYFILIPVDYIFGTLVTSGTLKKEDIFPGFNPVLSSTCGSPLIGRQ